MAAFCQAVSAISIHALLAESDNLRVLDGSKSSIISIHALLAESDSLTALMNTSHFAFLSMLSLRRATAAAVGRNCPGWISIHALLAESDRCGFRHNCARLPFLSMLSLRRATTCFPLQWGILQNFYPCSPCGERLHNADIFFCNFAISIHALLAESDLSYHCQIV